MRRNFRRQAVPAQAKAKSKEMPFVPPVRGWIRNENLASSGKAGAYVLDNFFPTSTGIRLRGGARIFATISGDPVESLWTYRSSGTQKCFAADETDIYDISSVADPEVAPTASVENQTAGKYATAQMGTVGGDYQFVVNGADNALIYDGTNFHQVTGKDLIDLPYDAETGTFTEGLVLTGGTSGATGTIITLTDDGTTGTMRVRMLTGEFDENETITDSSTGSATSNIPDGATIIAGAITGIDTSTFSHVWTFANRLFFIEKGTMNAWYLPVDSIAGAAGKFSLSGVFQDGGEVLFGGSWSLDSGAGLDDKCFFMSSTGEVAIYEGTNPASASTWAKVGVYAVTAPMGMNATLKAGGDVIIATEDGMVPISQAIQKDSAALSLSAITRAIEPEWKIEVSARRSVPWEVLKWPTNNMAVVSLPVIDATTDAYCFVVNLETGAWCRYTGWDTQCLTLYNDVGMFGTSAGKVYQMEVGGIDDTTPYTAAYVGSFEHLNRPGSLKTVHSAKMVFRADSDIIPQVSVSVNYTVSLPSPPSSIDNYSVDAWDDGLWDVATWDAGTSLTTKAIWASIGKTGFAIAPQIQITSGVTPTPHMSLVSIDLMYEDGGIMV